MIRLVSNSALSGQLLQAVLSGAVSANQPEATTSYIDLPPQASAQTQGQRGTTYQVALNSNTDVTIVSPPGAAPTGTTGQAGYVRMIDYVGIYNKDTASVTLTIKIDDAGTEKILWKGTLLTLEAVYYEDGRGWYAVDANGNIKEVTSSVFSSITVGGGTPFTTYLEGTWTPTDQSGAALSLTVNQANYTKIGRVVYFNFKITYPVTASGAAPVIGGLPFTVLDSLSSFSMNIANIVLDIKGQLVVGTTTFNIILANNNNTTNAALSTGIVGGDGFYSV